MEVSLKVAAQIHTKIGAGKERGLRLVCALIKQLAVTKFLLKGVQKWSLCHESFQTE